MTGPTREEVERFDACGGGGYIGTVPNGDYVRFSDYAALRERLEAAVALIAELRHRYADGQVALTEARAKLEAAEAECARLMTGIWRHVEQCDALEDALTEARAREAAAWEAGRDAAAGRAEQWLASAEENEIAFEKINDLGRTWSGHSEAANWIEKGIRRLTPPTDATAALTAVRDAEWNAAIEAAAREIDTVVSGFNRKLQNLNDPDEISRAVFLIGLMEVCATAIRALRRNPKEDV